MVEHINGVNPAANGGPARRLRRIYLQEQEAARGADKVQVSKEVRELSETEGIDMKKVLEVRKALREGTYITAEKLDSALDSALDDAFGPADETPEG
jgi:anti-sigma28 factor (negative regulator of flagellin synthesis)